jgi:hypothetical protein
MNLNFLPAKNGSLNCVCNNKYFHSNYNPENEAEKFVQSLTFNFIPEYIFITEPALSYCAVIFKKKFPDTKIIAIRFCNDFNNYNYLWDSVIFFNKASLDSNLDEFITEENFSSCVFLSWKNSENIFIDESREYWTILKNYLKIKHDLVNTKNYFSERWLKNTLNNSLNLINTATIKPGNIPVIIVASGTSLKNCIEKIIKYRKNFYLICVSSALSVLIYNNIIPDLCISTDGGFWAKKHLENTNKNIINKIPFVLPLEASVPFELLKNNLIVPLDYNDSFSTLIIRTLNIKTLNAKRNGTVSGTAIDFAFSITNGLIGIIGLDLHNSKSYSHTQPNALEKINSLNDYRINPLTNRLFKSEINNSSLEIYSQWFNKQNRFKNRVYRIFENEKPETEIKTMNVTNLQNFINESMKNISEKNSTINKNKNNNNEINKKLLKILNELKHKIKELNNYNQIKNDLYLYNYLDCSSSGELMLYKKYETEEYLKKLKNKSLSLIDKYINRLEEI